MRRIFMFALLALTLAGGVASADSYRYRGHGARDHRGGAYVQRTYPRQYHRPTYNSRYVTRPYARSYVRPYTRSYVRPYVGVVRRPIYVRAPVIPYRYYNYYQRPALIAETPRPIAGYLWVAGQWQWNGSEWIWRAGHYIPDPAFDNYGYDNAPSGTYYNNTY